uniref:Fucosyltransferase n=1 Tax=Lemna minor TaxID=4472 RepID=Q0PMD0_LEMMI|nr:alpha-1,3-fucosyltransferase [Lemna minor]
MATSAAGALNAGGRVGGRRSWVRLLPFFVLMLVVGEIWFLGRLDVVKNAAMVQNWTSSHLFFLPVSSYTWSETVKEEEDCKDWLERVDAVDYKRDFRVEPVLVNDAEQDWSSCSVGCKFGSFPGRTPDATFGFSQNPSTVSVHRSMESSHYYLENNLDNARRKGYQIVMTTSLLSDVPVGYFSWAEYDIMAPLQPKTAGALAAAFISNCGARNFRLQALDMLEKSNIKIDSYGACHRNQDGKVDKVQTLKRYKFSLAFENSNEDDYVTEKFFQSLVAGAIPVVVGAPNIQNFAPSSDSILHIREPKDVSSVAERMKFLASNPEAYNQSLRWKFEGPSNSFKALVDMAAVHSSCRLCIHIATKIREKEERNPNFKTRPCKCTRNGSTLYHLYARERGTFDFLSIFMRSDNLSLKALGSTVLEKFSSLKHVPIWKKERPESLKGGSKLDLYRIYPVGITQREALFSFQFNTDKELQIYLESHPCAKFEVIFI